MVEYLIRIRALGNVDIAEIHLLDDLLPSVQISIPVECVFK